jgi:hypothetical protein
MNLLLVLEITVGLIAVIAAVYGVTRFIDWRIERRIRDESFLKRIASSLRPTVIFDEDGAILVDQGAMELLTTIEVKKNEENGLPIEIIVEPRQYLAYQPLIETLDNELVDFSVKRAKGFAWSYSLEYQMTNDIFDGHRRFRLEVLR